MTDMIMLTKIETPLGLMTAGASDTGICLAEFDGGDRAQRSVTELKRLTGLAAGEGESVYFSALREQLEEYFTGTRRQFDLPLAMPGSDFIRSVWEELLTIPYGGTRSYKQQAEAMGKPETIRAVAAANGMNRIAVIIPCHRVIGSDGRLTGYAGGLWRKQRLLELERFHSGLAEPSLF